ncbi:MAG: fibronectin type III domain-containing protein [Thermoleophilia bacterium]
MRRLVFLFAVVAVLAWAGGAAGAGPTVTWCGTDATAADRPDAVAGLQWHVVYAYPADGLDRFGQLVSGIATDLSAIDQWWRGQDPTRTPRFDLADVPGCADAFGRLDVSHVQLPRAASVYAPIEGTLTGLASDLADAGLADPDKKYLVYYDGPTSDPLRCGEANAGLPDRGGRDGYSVVFLGVCSAQLGTAGASATITAAHELIHGLDVLSRADASGVGPPHPCPGDAGHPCDTPTDVMYPTANGGDLITGKALDAGRDDYYGHAGGWWDAQDSGWLIRLDSPDTAPPTGPARLTVTSARASNGLFATVSWPRARDASGVTYRLYLDGELFDALGPGERKVSLAAVAGETHRYAVRAVDPGGLLGPRVEVRFRTGLGIVDDAGKLVRDTVPPPPVDLRATTGPRGLTLRWKPVKDTGGPLKGYRVERNGRRFAVVTRTSIAIPAAKARGTWSVRAIDRAGNVGPVTRTFRVG